MHKYRDFKAQSRARSPLLRSTALSKSGLATSGKRSSFLSMSGVQAVQDGVKRGKICKVCDNKFMMLAEYSKYSDSMEHQDAHIEVLT